MPDKRKKINPKENVNSVNVGDMYAADAAGVKPSDSAWQEPPKKEKRPRSKKKGFGVSWKTYWNIHVALSVMIAVFGVAGFVFSVYNIAAFIAYGLSDSISFLFWCTLCFGSALAVIQLLHLIALLPRYAQRERLYRATRIAARQMASPAFAEKKAEADKVMQQEVEKKTQKATAEVSENLNMIVQKNMENVNNELRYIKSTLDSLMNSQFAPQVRVPESDEDRLARMMSIQAQAAADKAVRDAAAGRKAEKPQEGTEHKTQRPLDIDPIKTVPNFSDVTIGNPDEDEEDSYSEEDMDYESYKAEMEEARSYTGEGEAEPDWSEVGEEVEEHDEYDTDDEDNDDPDVVF